MAYAGAVTKATDPEERRARRPLGLRLRAYADVELAHACAALGWHGPRRHEGVHLARKHLRRARAVLALVRKPLDQAGHAIDRRVRRLVRGLGRLRDAQAMLETLTRLSEEIAPLKLPHHAAVRAALRRERDGVLAVLLDRDPDLERLRRGLQAVRVRLDGAAWSEVKARHVDAALARSERRLRDAATRARQHGTAARRHLWRRRWRRLRQQITALETVSRRRRNKQADGGHWSTVLGEEHDLQVLRRRIATDVVLDACSRKAWTNAVKAALQRRRAVPRNLHR